MFYGSRLSYQKSPGKLPTNWISPAFDDPFLAIPALFLSVCPVGTATALPGLERPKPRSGGGPFGATISWEAALA